MSDAWEVGQGDVTRDRCVALTSVHPTRFLRSEDQHSPQPVKLGSSVCGLLVTCRSDTLSAVVLAPPFSSVEN